MCAMVPENVLLTNGSPYLLPHKSTELNWAILGVLSSRIFDWYCRRYVEGTMRQGILNAAPFPEMDETRLMEIATLSQSLESPTTDPKRGADLAKLDFLVAKSFNLDFEDVEVIMTTFHKTWDPSAHLDNISKQFSEGDQ